MVLDFIMKFLLLIILIYTSTVNPVIGSDPTSCTNRIIAKTFVLLRFFLAVMFFLFMGYNIGQIDWFTISINWENWWKEKDEKFLTNGSWFNATICWFLFFGGFTFICFQSAFIIFNTIELFNDRRTIKLKLESLFVETMEYIFTREGFLQIISSESRAAESLPPKSTLSDLLQTEAKKHKFKLGNGNSQILTQECAICISQFLVKEQCLKLSCAHFYHFDCLMNWLGSRQNIDSKCPLCKQPI